MRRHLLCVYASEAKLVASNGVGLGVRDGAFVPVSIYWLCHGEHGDAYVLGRCQQGHAEPVVIVVVTIVVVRIEQPGVRTIVPVATPVEPRVA